MSGTFEWTVQNAHVLTCQSSASSAPVARKNALMMLADGSQYHLLPLSKFHLSHINLCILVFFRNSDCRVCCQSTLLLAVPGSPSWPFNTLQLVTDHPAYRDSRVIKIPTKTRCLSYYLPIRNKICTRNALIVNRGFEKCIQSIFTCLLFYKTERLNCNDIRRHESVVKMQYFNREVHFARGVSINRIYAWRLLYETFIICYIIAQGELRRRSHVVCACSVMCTCNHIRCKNQCRWWGKIDGGKRRVR